MLKSIQKKNYLDALSRVSNSCWTKTACFAAKCCQEKKRPIYRQENGEWFWAEEEREAWVAFFVLKYSFARSFSALFTYQIRMKCLWQLWIIRLFSSTAQTSPFFPIVKYLPRNVSFDVTMATIACFLRDIAEIDGWSKTVINCSIRFREPGKITS